MTHHEQIDRSVSRTLLAKAEEMGVYRNPAGKGDGREDLIRDIVALRLGTLFGIVKGEIVDSNGIVRTVEHDIAIYDQSSASCLFAVGHRRVVRIESMAMVAEVKTVLDRGAVRQVDDAIESGLGSLLRFYLPEGPIQTLFAMPRMRNFDMEAVRQQADALRTTLREGLGARRALDFLPGVLSALVAYDGPAIDTAKAYLGTPHIDVICVVGKYTIAKRVLGIAANPDEIAVWGEGDDALGGFLAFTESSMDRFRVSRQFVRPNLFRYFNPDEPPQF